MMQEPKLSNDRQRVQRMLAAAAVLMFTLTSLASAAPLEGTLIGNQASATYKDTGGVDRTAFSNIVQTQVTQVAGVSVTPTGTTTLTASAGSQIEFPMTVTNTGNGDDSFDLTAVDTLGPDFTMTSVAIYEDGGGGTPIGSPIISTPILGAGASFQIVIVAITPAGASDTDQNDITVTASSVLTPAVTSNATDRTQITVDAVMTVTKSITPSNSGDPGDTGYTVTIQYQNTGSDTATAFTLTDVLPAGMDYQTDSGRWSVTGATVLTDLVDGSVGTAPNTIDYDFTAGTMTAVINQVLPGQSGEVTFDFDVAAAAAAGVIANTIDFAYNDGSANVGPFSSNNALFTINQVYAVSVSDDTVSVAVPQGSIVDFTNVVTNSGNGADTFTLAYANIDFPVGTSFQIFENDGSTPFVDPTTSVAAGGTYTVILRATLPPSATGTDFDVTLTATSAGDGTVSGSGNDQLDTVTASAVDLTVNAGIPPSCGAACGEGVNATGEPAPVDTQSTPPGASVTFTLFVNNTSAITDNYDMAASTDSSFASLTLPAGWTVSFEDSVGTPLAANKTGPILAGANMEVRAIVTVPAGAPAIPAPGQSLFFRALSALTLAADVSHDAVVVDTARSVALVASSAGTGFPGGFVDYAHTLTNNGNVTENSGGGETITLGLTDLPATFSSAVYIDVNANGTYDAGTDTPVSVPADIGPIAPGASVLLVVRVTIPAGAPLGSTATTTVTATTAGTINGAPPPGVSSVDDVTTVSENVALVKEQGIDTDCDGTLEIGYTTTLQLAAPGACIHYRITGTNNAAADVTTVVLSDSTPAETTYDDAGGTSAASVTLGSITSVPALGGTGTIAATVGTLTSGSSVELRFVVRIDP